MANVLPKKDKKGARKEYHLRYSIVGLTFFLVSCIIALLFLLPSFIASDSQQKSAERHLDALERIRELREENEGQIVAHSVNKKLDAVVIKNSLSLEDVLWRVLGARPIGVTVTRISYVRSTELARALFAAPNTIPASLGKVLVSGIAQDRDSLLRFKGGLEREVFFKSIDLPISNLAKSTNVEFALTIELRGN